MTGIQPTATTCPHCGSDKRQVRAGMHGGNQRYKCMACQRRYTPEPRSRGYGEDVRRQAYALHTAGAKPRSIAGTLGVTPQTIANWIGQGSPAPTPPVPDVDPAETFAPISGKRKPTISDVASHAGVSVATVSNYFNDKGRMGNATRERVEKAVKELHFTPNALMRGIRHRRTRILGVMMFDLSSLDQNVGTAIAPQMLAGINAAAFDAAHNILLYTGLSYRPQSSAGTEFLDGHIDGLIWVSREINEPILERVAAAGLPTVALLTRQVPEGVGYVQADNPMGMRALVAYLAGQGHRRIAYAGSAHSWSVVERHTGYRQGLEDAGLPFAPELECIDPAMRHSEAAYEEAVARWLALPEPPTAIMVQYDRGASLLLRALEARGLRVPEDIAVTGFDDAPDARWLGGGLTTVRQPFSPMGRLAVQSLIKLIENTPAEECRHVIPVELVVRGSTRSDQGMRAGKHLSST